MPEPVFHKGIYKFNLFRPIWNESLTGVSDTDDLPLFDHSGLGA